MTTFWQLQLQLLQARDQASCKYLPRSCCPTAGTVRHGGTGTCMRVCLCCAYALLWRQWDNSCVEDIYMKPGRIDGWDKWDMALGTKERVKVRKGGQ